LDLMNKVLTEKRGLKNGYWKKKTNG
jgi:hypothetical protein